MPIHYDPREEEERRKRARIARSQVQQAPLAQRQGTQGPGAVGGGNQIANQLLKGVLTGALGPVGTLFGGLFNKGGMVQMQGYNVGGWLYSLFGKKPAQRNPQAPSWWMNPNKMAAEKEKQKLRQSGGPSIWQQTGRMSRNMGGAIPNPNGYNEGGSVGETPIKKVMDEQKLEQQAMAFDLEQKRKQEAHDMAMKQKQQQFATAQKMKKESAMTNKKPKTPLSK